MAKSLLILRKSPLDGAAIAFLAFRMISAPSPCPISTRPAYYGTRRIAPVAATSRIEAWGARPAVEELRPARSADRRTASVSKVLPLPTAHFVAHVIAQMLDGEALTAAIASASYEKADGLGRTDPPQLLAYI